MKSFKSIISAGLLLYVSLGISQIAEAQDEARTEAIELYNNAQDLAQNSNFAEAIELYREALTVARANQLDDISDLVVERLPRVHLSQASEAYRAYQANQNVANIDVAIERFNEAAEVAGEFNDQEVQRQAMNAIPQLYYVRGVLNYRLENYQEAMAALDQAIEMNANYAAAYYQKGLTQKQLTPNDVDAFLQWYDRAIMIAEQTNDNRTLQSATNAARDELIYRGVTLGEDRQFGQAIELLNRVEQYDNASDEQQYRLAEIYNMRSDWSSAATHARRALELHDGGVADTAKIYFELAIALKGLGEYPAACSAFENARYGNFTGPANHELQFELKCEGYEIGRASCRERK